MLRAKSAPKPEHLARRRRRNLVLLNLAGSSYLTLFQPSTDAGGKSSSPLLRNSTRLVHSSEPSTEASRFMNSQAQVPRPVMPLPVRPTMRPLLPVASITGDVKVTPSNDSSSLEMSIPKECVLAGLIVSYPVFSAQYINFVDGSDGASFMTSVHAS